MVERFGYSLDIGKSLENDEDSEHKADSAKEESKKEESVEKETPAVSDNEITEESPEAGSQGDNAAETEAKVDSEDFGEPIVDDSDEEITGEMLSANKVKKDILDEIKEDVEGVSEASGSVRADSDVEDLEDDKEVFNPTSEEAYSEESTAGNIADGAQEESYVSEEKPLTPEEADVKDMVDESFKENNDANAILEEDQMQTSSLWKWGAGILVLLVLTFVVVKFGFIGPVDNNPTTAVPVDEVPLETDSTDSLVTDVIPPIEEAPVVPIEPEPLPEPVPIVKEKDPEQLLNILKEGLE